MADTKDIEVLVGKESTEQADPSKTTKSSPTLPKEDSEAEVSGRVWVPRRMLCRACHGISWIDYDTENFHTYTCCYCGCDNTL